MSAVRIVVAAAALIDLAIVLLVLAAGRLSLRIGPVRLRSAGDERLAAISVAIWALCAFVLWRPRWLRRVAVAGLVIVFVLGVVLLARRTPFVFPIGDGAVIESYTLLATQGKLLLGPYSRFIWHHPGPMYFLLLAPFYVMTGYQSPGVHVGALAINVLSLVALAWIVRRTASGVLSLALTVFAALFVWRTSDLLVSTWNPHVTLVPTLTLIPLCAAAAAGDLWLVPLVAVVATFIAQTHVGFTPLALAVSGVALAGAVACARSPRGLFDARVRRVLNITAWVIVVLWLPPIVEQLTRSPGNLTRLWQFFVGDHGPTQPLGRVFVAWAESLSAPFAPAMKPGWGSPFRPSGQWWPAGFGALQTLLVAAVAAWAAITARRFLAVMAGMSLLASAVAFWSVSRIAEDLVDHEVFWIAALGALNGAVIVAGIAGAIGARTGRSWRAPGRLVAAASWMPVAISVVMGVYYLGNPRGFSPMQRTEDAQVRTLVGGIQSYLRGNGVSKPLFRMDFRTWAVTAGIVLQLERAGVGLAVEDSAVPIFSDAVAPTGDEDAEITIALTPRHVELAERADNRLIASYDRYYADVVRLTPTRRR